MNRKQKSVVSLSVLPKRVTDGRDEILGLEWNKRALVERIHFALALCCEGPVVFHVEFVDSLQIATLNWQFRGKDTPTDVLSFPPHFDSVRSMQSHEPVNLGELAVCVDVCMQQSKKHRVTLAQELEKMILHGLIHLKGFDHERSDAAHAVMSSLERSILKQLTQQLGSPDFCLLRAAQKKGKVLTRGRR